MKKPKLLNKIFAKLGYYPRDKFGDFFREIVKDSIKRNGEGVETVKGGVRIRVHAKPL